MKQIIRTFLWQMIFSVSVLSQTTIGLKEKSDSIKDFPSLKAFLKSTMKKKDILILQAKGDLNQDRVADWVGIIKTPTEPFSNTRKLYVLLGKEKDSYQVEITTHDVPGGGMGCCWVEALEIRNGSIYIQNVAKSVSDYRKSTHQFKLDNGEWRLIGLKILYQDSKYQTSETTDINLLTGKIIEAYRERKRKPVSKTYQKKFADYFLKDFDFEVDFGSEREEEEEKL